LDRQKSGNYKRQKDITYEVLKIRNRDEELETLQKQSKLTELTSLRAAVNNQPKQCYKARESNIPGDLNVTETKIPCEGARAKCVSYTVMVPTDTTNYRKRERNCEGEYSKKSEQLWRSKVDNQLDQAGVKNKKATTMDFYTCIKKPLCNDKWADEAGAPKGDEYDANDAKGLAVIVGLSVGILVLTVVAIIIFILLRKKRLVRGDDNVNQADNINQRKSENWNLNNPRGRPLNKVLSTLVYSFYSRFKRDKTKAIAAKDFKYRLVEESDDNILGKKALGHNSGHGRRQSLGHDRRQNLSHEWDATLSDR